MGRKIEGFSHDLYFFVYTRFPYWIVLCCACCKGFQKHNQKQTEGTLVMNSIEEKDALMLAWLAQIATNMLFVAAYMPDRDVGAYKNLVEVQKDLLKRSQIFCEIMENPTASNN